MNKDDVLTIDLEAALNSLTSSDWIDGGTYMVRLSENINHDSRHLLILRVSNDAYSISGTDIMTERVIVCPSVDRIKFLVKFPVGIIQTRFADTQTKPGVSKVTVYH